MDRAHDLHDADGAGDGAPTGVDIDTYRRVIGRYATGVTVVTTRVDGVDHAMTVNAFTSVSLDPLLVLFCAEKIARFHDAVIVSGTWAASVLAADGEEASRWFATRGRPVTHQLRDWAHVRGDRTGAAVLTDVLAALECRTHAVYDGGDHSIVVGEVLNAWLPRSEGSPLVYYEGGYRRLDTG